MPITKVTLPYEHKNGEKADADKVNANESTVLASANSAIDSINAASGTAKTLERRLAVALNADGTPRSEITGGGEWVFAGDEATRVDDLTFTVSGDKRDRYTSYRRVRLTVSGLISHSEVVSSSFDANADTTTVTLADGIVTGTVQLVEHSFYDPAFPAISEDYLTVTAVTQATQDATAAAEQATLDAQTARVGAEAAESSALTAQTAAEVAQTAAETAQTAAETALADTVAEHDSAIAEINSEESDALSAIATREAQAVTLIDSEEADALSAVTTREAQAVALIDSEEADALSAIQSQGASSVAEVQLEGSVADGDIGVVTSPVVYAPLNGTMGLIAGGSPATHTRSGNATYISSGRLRTVGANVPRFEHGMLKLEPATTNICTYSQTFTNSKYNYLEGSAIHGQQNIDGTDDAVRFIENTNNDTHQLQVTSNTVSAGKDITWSVVIEPFGSQRYVKMLHGNYSLHETRGDIIVDLSTGTVERELTVTGSGTVKGKVEDLGNGRLRILFMGGRTASSGAVNLYINTATTPDGPTTYTGDGSSGFILHHVQLEELPFATSYVKSDASPATRGAHSITMPAPKTLDFARGCSFLFDILVQGATNDHQYPFMWGNDWPNSLRAFLPSDVSFICASDSGTHVAESGEGEFSTETLHTVMFTFEGDSLKLFIDGEMKAESATFDGVMPDNMPDHLCLGGNINEDNHLFGYIGNFRIYDRILTQQQARLF